MAKALKKLLITENNPQNTLIEYKKTSKKSRQQIYQENYQKNKEKKKAQQKERYIQKKEQAKEQTSKYYGAETIKVLMSLKEYTELNSAKRKLWLDFIWTFKDLSQIEINNIIEVMRIRELAENLINDYWTTAKNEIRKGKNWNGLDQEQKERLINYWGREKVRKDKKLLSELKQQEIDGKAYEKEIELAKFHEERGKIKCSCYSCEEKQVIRKEVRAKIDKELKELEKQETDNEKGECFVCGKIKELEEETGACKKCSTDYGN